MVTGVASTLLVFSLVGCTSPYPAGFWQEHSQEYVPLKNSPLGENAQVKMTFTNSDAIIIRQFKQKYPTGAVITDCPPGLIPPNHPCKLLQLKSDGRVVWDFKSGWIDK